MNQPNTELEAWLSGVDLFEPASNDLEDWVAGFDADRQLVVFKLGPFKRLFLRPETFQKRFYHQIYPLAIQSWPYRRQIQLFDDFCTLDIELNIRFQATLAYAQKNSEILEMLNQHIQQVYTAVIEDRINQELSSLADGVWVQKGLSNHEKRLAVSVCEILTLQHIQAEALCHMSASFAEFPEVQLGKDSVYLHVLKKTFEIHQQKQAELEHLKQLAEMQRQIQLQEAEAQLQLLEDKEQQIARQRDVERRIHAEQINHEQQLKEISLEIELRGQQELESRQRLAETQLTTDRLAHQTFLTEKQTIAEIERQAMIQRRRREANQLEVDDYDVRTDE